MKKLANLLITLMITLAAFTASAQVKVTGHVSAEVVESVSAHNAISQNVNYTGENDRIALGSIVLEGPRNSAFDISVQNATIYNETGSYSLSTGFSENQNTDNTSKQSLSLSALIEQNVPDGDYDGKLTVIVSYN